MEDPRVTDFNVREKGWVCDRCGEWFDEEPDWCPERCGSNTFTQEEECGCGEDVPAPSYEHDCYYNRGLRAECRRLAEHDE